MSEPKKPRGCRNCCFAVQTTYALECRKNPPRIVDRYDQVGKWPYVYEEDWCGAWTPTP